MTNTLFSTLSIGLNPRLANWGAFHIIYDGKEGLNITRKWIVDQKQWNEDSIQERANELIKLLLQEVIPYPKVKKTPKGEGRRAKRSFAKLGLVGKTIVFSMDRSVLAEVITENEILYNEKKWAISTLTADLIQKMTHTTTKSKYNGFEYWEYNGVRLVDLDEISNK